MAAEYEVLTIDQRIRSVEPAGVETYYRHTIKTKGGIVLEIDIAEKDFTPAKAAPILLKHAQNADAILKL